MSDNRFSIEINAISKKYALGTLNSGYMTFRETIYGLFERNSSSKKSIYALENVSFHVDEGEVVGLIGGNGAGKSTLLKILSRITPPSTGYAKIHGRIGSLLEVGTGFHPELTGRENIYLSGSILGMKKQEIESKYDEIIKFSELEQFLETPVKRYSSGMYVRLAFAVAAHLEPEILLIDEVLAVGDLKFQNKCLGRMKNISRSGRTIIFVSHNMSAINSLCSRAILLDKGQLIFDGNTAEAISKYFEVSFGKYGEIRWDNIENAPGEQGFKLRSFEITSEDKEPLTTVRVDEAILLRITYRTLKENMQFRIALALYAGGVCAFTILEPEENIRKDIGEYYSEVEIPKNFLAEMNYSVYLSVFSSAGTKNHYCRIPNLTMFQAYDPMTGASARGDYAQNIEGIVRPKLKWKTGLKSRQTE
jgi:ABC-type polysaccharide/polyol phosphate transport system, ATPase component